MESVEIVQKFFPKVEKVVDAKRALVIEVTEADNKSAKVMDHRACALAVACKRTTKSDGVIVSVKTAYVVNGHIATRYKLPESVSREVVSFDRDAGFAPGTYMMLQLSPTQRFGAITSKRKPSKRVGQPMPKHYTAGIRSSLRG